MGRNYVYRSAVTITVDGTKRDVAATFVDDLAGAVKRLLDLLTEEDRARVLTDAAERWCLTCGAFRAACGCDDRSR